MLLYIFYVFLKVYGNSAWKSEFLSLLCYLYSYVNKILDHDIVLSESVFYLYFCKITKR